MKYKVRRIENIGAEFNTREEALEWIDAQDIPTVVDDSGYYEVLEDDEDD